MLSLALFGLIATLVTDGRAQKTFAKTETFEEKDGYFGGNEELAASIVPAVVSAAEACGAPVSAIEEGLVVEVKNDGWNEGRGSYIKIEGVTITSYIHLKDVAAEVGTLVKKGDVIGTTGRSGLSSNSPCVRETE